MKYDPIRRSEIQKVQNKIGQVNQDIPLDWSIPSPLPDHHQLPPKLDPEILPEPLAEFCHSASLENETAPEAATVFIRSMNLAGSCNPCSRFFLERWGARRSASGDPTEPHRTAVLGDL